MVGVYKMLIANVDKKEQMKLEQCGMKVKGIQYLGHFLLAVLGTIYSPGPY